MHRCTDHRPTYPGLSSLPCSADPAARRWGRGRLICHAAETSAAILALAITVIEARFQAPLIASIGLPQLFPPGLLPTFCTAVREGFEIEIQASPPYYPKEEAGDVDGAGNCHLDSQRPGRHGEIVRAQAR
jgi:hypothetical protein